MKLARIEPRRLVPLIAEAKRITESDQYSHQQRYEASKQWGQLTARMRAEKMCQRTERVSRIVWVFGYAVFSLSAVGSALVIIVRHSMGDVRYLAVAIVGFIITLWASRAQRPHIAKLRAETAAYCPMEDDFDS